MNPANPRHLRVLVVDDEEEMQDVCAEILEELDGVRTSTASEGGVALARVREQQVDLLIADIRMPEMTGLDLLRAVREVDRELPVLLMTGYPTVDNAVQALRLGAADYLTKPFHPDELLEHVKRLLDQQRITSEHRVLSRQLAREHLFGEMVGVSPPMRRLFGLVDRAAQTDLPALIVGETGTGKELVARALHRRSGREGSCFIPVDCGAIPEGLMESELFGHEAGAFTGATERAMGLMELANGGTFFLDEISELPLSLQAKLLRALQEKSIRRVGGQREFEVDVRVVAATHRDPGELVQSGTFREDLFYRLNGIRIEVPPLRDRGEDIPLLVTHFLESASGPDVPPARMDDEAIEILCSHAWPGNVRELQNVVRRAVALATGPLLGAEDLPEELVLHARSETGAARGGFFQRREEMLARFEREYLEGLLESCAGRVSKAAKAAGIPRGTLYRLLKRSGVDPKDFRNPPPA